MNSLRIAVVGAGIAGLSAAWLLAKRHRVTLYEKQGHLGGHANTVVAPTHDGPTNVDTGFIVYNERNYPNLTALFNYLKIPTNPTEMSFSFSLAQGRYEYAGSGATGFFGQPSNIANPRHWSLLKDIAYFFRTAQSHVKAYPDNLALGEFLSREGYGKQMVENHIIPMGAAIWSTPADEMLKFPARSFVDFYANHGMLQFRNRPAWRTVSGGSKTYVDKLLADSNIEVHRYNAVMRVARHPGYIHLADAAGTVRPFDHVVLALHADEALHLLEESTPEEKALLGCFQYQENLAILHRDERWMPKRKHLWSSWNYLKHSSHADRNVCLTYWMNRLQNLKPADNLFVTLNPSAPIHPKAVLETFAYRHPVFSSAANQVKGRLWQLQGSNRTWYCGSYFGDGFHEDGLQSGLAVAEDLGQVRRPWNVENESGRIVRNSPVFFEAAE
jgi:predicted NAD/FAD-binding protein